MQLLIVLATTGCIDPERPTPTATTPTPTCGDGVVQGTEDCDLGPSNADTGACTSRCQNAWCGDGFVQAGVEECEFYTYPNSGTQRCGASCRVLDQRLLADADAALLGQPDDAVGRLGAVSSAGDVDGDGFGDLILGAARGSGAGVAYLVRGPILGELDLAAADALLVGEALDNVGSVSGAGDVDGDGAPDLLVGAHHGEKVYVVSGAVAGTYDLANAAVILLGTTDAIGVDVAGAGDVNGDGIADVLISAAEQSGAHVWLVHGPVAGSPSLADVGVELVGEPDGRPGSVSTAGDVDGDGLDDVLVGDTSGWGSAYVVLGPVDDPQVDLGAADAVLRGGYGGDAYAGFSLGGGGDVNGDGLGDIVVGAPGAGGDSGSAYVLTGPLAGEISLLTSGTRLEGEQQLDEAGSSVAIAGDVDADGFDDVLVGAPAAEAAYLVYGSASFAPRNLGDAEMRFLGNWIGSERDWAGSSVAGAGDVDGDGVDDVLIGAPGHAEGGGAVYLLLGPP